jgi:hypothetical protein
MVLRAKTDGLAGRENTDHIDNWVALKYPVDTHVWAARPHYAYTASDPIDDSMELVPAGTRGRIGWHDTGKLGIFWEPEGKWGRWDLYAPESGDITWDLELVAKFSLLS